MANPPKKRGTAAETALLRWLHARGHRHALRNPPNGNRDVGDLSLPGVVIEVKNVKNVARALREGLVELAVEQARAGAPSAVLVVKPAGVGLERVGEWYAVRRVADDPELGAA